MIDFAAARAAALVALGHNGETLLERLEAAGLVVVLQDQLPVLRTGLTELKDVQLIIPEAWRETASF